MGQFSIKGILIALLVVLLGVFSSGKMSNENREYLESSAEKSGTTFLTLSAIKGAVAIFEGSTVGAEFGVTADIQVGDAVQPIYDFVDLAWRLSLASVSMLLLINAVVNTIQSWGVFLLVLTGLIWGGIFIARCCGKRPLENRGLFSKIARLSVVLSICIYIVLPMSVGVARYLSEKISAPMIVQGADDFEQLKVETSQEQIQLKYFDEVSSAGSVWNAKARIAKVKDKLQEFSEWCKTRTVTLIENGIRFCAGICFDCFIFPLSVGLSVYWGIKLGMAENRSIKSEITNAFKEIDSYQKEQHKQRVLKSLDKFIRH